MRVLGAAGMLVVILGVLEVGLQQAGVGAAEQAVFAPAPDQEGYQVLNVAYVQRYFNSAFKPDLAFTPFRTEKTPGSFRVVVLGGSTAAGFPYPFYLGFPARLQHRLEAFAAGQPVEVINLGIANTNSYALWDLKEAVVAQAPDAVVLYTGHNEYFGAFGVGSAVNTVVQTVGMKRFALRLKRLVLYRALERFFTGAPPEGDLPAAHMLGIAEDTNIPLDGSVYRAGLAQFETNMQDVLQTFREHGIPVYAGTLVSNLKNQTPVGSEATADYESGDELLAVGDTLGAHALFVSAKEKDEARLRAPEAMNEALVRWAREDLLMLVDLQPLALAPSLFGVEDEMFFDDHLHPNHIGYDTIAEAFFEVMKTHPALESRDLNRFSDAYLQPIAYERAYAHLQVASMRAGPLGEGPEKQMALRQMLGIYISSFNYLDSLVVRTFMEGLPVEAALQAALPKARSQGDTLRTLLLHRSLLHWRPFDDEATREAASFAETTTDSTLLALREEIILHALNRTGEAVYLDKLAALKRRQGLPEDAASLEALAEERRAAAR